MLLDGTVRLSSPLMPNFLLIQQVLVLSASSHHVNSHMTGFTKHAAQGGICFGVASVKMVLEPHWVRGLGGWKEDGLQMDA